MKIKSILKKVPLKSHAFWLCLTFAVLYMMLGWRLADTLIYDYDGLLFHTDTAEVAEDITEFQTRNHGDTNVHPLFVIFINPIGSFLSSFIPSTATIILLNTVFGTMIVWLAFCCFRLLGLPKYQSTLWTVLTGCTASNLMFVSLPERHIFATFSIALMCLFCLKYPGKTGKFVWAGLLTLGFTITNFLQCIILFFVSTFHRGDRTENAEKSHIGRTIRFILLTLLLAVALSLLQKKIWPDTRYFFLPEVYAEETDFFNMPSDSTQIAHKILELSAHMFVFNIAAPMPFIDSGEAFAPLTLGLKSFMSYRPIGLMALSGWSLVLLLSLNILFFHKHNKWFWLQAGIVLCLLFNAAMHMIYGDDLFLYTVNWTFLLILLIASTTVYANRSTAFRLTLNTIMTFMVSAVVINNALFISDVSHYLKNGDSMKWQLEYAEQWELAQEVEMFLIREQVDTLFSGNKYKWFANVTEQRVKVVDIPNERSPALKKSGELSHDSYAFLFDSDSVIPFIKHSMGSYSEHSIDQYRFYYDIVPPLLDLAPISSDDILSIHTRSSTNQMPAVIDLNLDTHWTSKSDADATIEFTFTEKKPVSCVKLFSGPNRYPYEWQIETRESPTNEWAAVTSKMQRSRYFWSGPRLFWNGRQLHQEARFVTVMATGLRILLPEDQSSQTASVSEILIYGPGEALPFETTAIPLLIEELYEKKITKLYSERWVANAVYARTSALRGKAAIKVQTLLEPYVFEHKRSRPQPEIESSPYAIYVSKDTAILTRAENAATTRHCLRTRGYNMRETTIGPWILFDFRNSEWQASLAGYNRLYWGGISCFLAEANGAAKKSAKEFTRLALRERNDTTAQSYLEKALLFYPGYQDAIEKLSYIYREQSKDTEADTLQERLSELTVPTNKADIKFGKAIEMKGITADEGQFSPGDNIHIRYLWTYKPDRKSTNPYSVFIHFQTQDKTIFQGDHDFCAEFSKDELLTQSSEEIFSENMTHTIPTNAPTGDYRIVIGIYDKQRKTRLRAITDLKDDHDAVVLFPLLLEWNDLIAFND